MQVSLDVQRDTMRRTLLASCGALLYSFVILISYSLGYILIDGQQLLILMCVFWAGHIANIIFVRLRYKQQATVPSMTLPHMVWAISFVSIILYHTVEIRPALMMAYLTILPFGAFRLRWRGFLGITFFTLSCYALALFLLQQTRPGHWYPEVEAIIGLTFLLSMFGYCTVGHEFSSLRERLSTSNDELKLALEKIEELAITDELTGLYNRRHLLKILDQQRAIANREGTPFVLAFIDLDKFKLINDLYGHGIGDEVLCQFSELLTDSVREIDLVSRYGGEEFVLLLNGVGIDTATIVVERIRQAVEVLPFTQSDLHMTISVGITEYRAPETITEAIERADKLLYDAKREGRNRVVQNMADVKA
jgi:diguanylate cyclase (GGDEF)-like protein